MYKYNTPQELFTAICDKIRDKTNSNELINHQDIPDKIDDLVDSDIINEYNELLSIINQDTIIELNNNEIENINIRYANCTNLTTVNLPKCTSIGNYTFKNCTNLTTVNLPKCTSIGDYAFYNCTSLATIDLPECTSIGNRAFEDCINIITLILANNQVVVLENVGIFTGSSIKNGTGYIYVPDDLVDSYKIATNWSTYANQIKPISEQPNNIKEEYGYV